MHWLEYGGSRFSLDRENKQLEELRNYLRNDPTAKAEGYFKNTGDVFAKVVRLECSQTYDDLDMDVNSGFNKSLKRLSRKPPDIEYSVVLTQEIYEGVKHENTAQSSINTDRREVESMKLVYVASPVRGDVEENLKKANRYCEYVAGCGHIPVAPHLAWQGFLHEDIPGNREKALAMGLKLIDYCSEVWVCGDEISQGMQGEIDHAEKLNKPIMYILQERIDENLKIRQGLEPLSTGDCVPDSTREDYQNKILVLDPQALISNARNAQNSLWIAYNGFGCTYGARGQAVYAKNLFDGRESQWERADFLGVVKPESLQKWLDDMPVRSEAAHTYAQEAEQCQADDFEI